MKLIRCKEVVILPLFVICCIQRLHERRGVFGRTLQRLVGYSLRTSQVIHIYLLLLPVLGRLVTLRHSHLSRSLRLAHLLLRLLLLFCCMKPQSLSKLLIRAAANSSVGMKGIIQLLSVLIPLLARRIHVFLEVLPRSRYCAVCFQRIVKLVEFISTHIYLCINLYYRYAPGRLILHYSAF